MLRRGMTLLELLVVIAIIGVLLALLVPAVQRVRDVALRTESMNNLKQIILAAHHYAENHQGLLPGYDGNKVGIFSLLLPYVEQPSISASEKPGYAVLVYISPADPSIFLAEHADITSYAANFQVFHNYPSLNRTFRDGTSNTIAFAEHYAKCGYTFLYRLNQILPLGPPWRRATFADDERGDVVPVTQGQPPVSTGSKPGQTFQVRPSLRECNSALAQSPHPGGMLVAMGDGSIRIVTQGISESSYWAAVTPRSGELLGADW